MVEMGCGRADKKKLSRAGIHGILGVSMQQVSLGMLGGGTVGSGVFHAWQKNGALMAGAPGRAGGFPPHRREGI